MQLPLLIYLDLFETLQVFRTWSEDVHVDIILRLFFFFNFFFAYQTE